MKGNTTSKRNGKLSNGGYYYDPRSTNYFERLKENMHCNTDLGKKLNNITPRGKAFERLFILDMYALTKRAMHTDLRCITDYR